MNEKKIEITVSPLGATTIKTSGFTGRSCKDATRDLERALGVAGNEHLLPEYFMNNEARDQLRQGH
jgi:hypothetical protein